MREGVNIEGAQQAICSGSPYGGREHSASEREAACLQYEQMTVRSDSQTTPEFPLLLVSSVVLCIVLLVVIVSCIFHKRRVGK